MEILIQTTTPHAATASEHCTALNRMLSGDQHFLLYFIMGNYFGPDLKEFPQKSVLQRKAEGLPSYTIDQLAGSHMKKVEVERIYYYILRKAEKSLSVKLTLLQSFFHGTIPTFQNDLLVAYPQYPELFPPHLHPHSRFKNKYKMIENIVFINDPNTSHIYPDEINRFKKLTGLENLQLDKVAARFHISGDGSTLYDVSVLDAEPIGQLTPLKSYHRSGQAKGPTSTLQLGDQHLHVPSPLRTMPYNASPPVVRCTAVPTRTVENGSPGILFLPSCPSKEELSSILSAGKSGFAVTGSAAMGKLGPIIGLMDIGECDDAYIFRVSLPGVRRDDREFSCQVENDGKVHIKGVTTTGERIVHKFSQAFEMQSKNLCPPGEFSISFQLPGPVNAQQFTGHYGIDGILEGIVMKQMYSS